MQTFARPSPLPPLVCTSLHLGNPPSPLRVNVVSERPLTENCFLFQICTLDPVTVINRLLISVLPLELAQDVYTYSGSDHERAKMAGALLTGYFLPLFSIDFLES